MARRRGRLWPRRVRSFLTALGLLLTAPNAIAGDTPPGRATESAAKREPTPADIETALQLYKEGKQRREHGDLAGAAEKLRAAHALVETPITTFELGRTYALMGKLVEARELLLSVSRIPVRKNESQRAAEARTEAESLAAELRPRLASITVRVRSADAAPPPKIVVDGAVVPPEAASAPRVVNPGRHVVVLDTEGRTNKAEVTVAEGQSSEVVIDAPAPPTSAGITAVLPALPGSYSPVVYAGFGAAAVGIVVGTITGVMTLSKAGKLDDVCQGDRCPPSAQSDLDSVSTTGTISTVAFVIAGLGVGVGVYGLLTSPKSAPAARVRLVPTGIVGAF